MKEHRVIVKGKNRMWTGSQYKPLSANQFMIDKSETLEKALISYPFVYLQGAAASGKSVCVKMLLSRRADVNYIVVRLDEFAGADDDLLTALADLRRGIEEKGTWVIFENCPGYFSAQIAQAMCAFLNHLQYANGNPRVIFCGRERMPECFLDFLWKRQMELIPQKNFLFTREETKKYVNKMGCGPYAAAIYEMTGGWPGCVDLMARMVEKRLQYGAAEIRMSEIRRSYEIGTYIEKNILQTLSGEERELLRYAAVCPWLDGALCQDLWGMDRADECLKILEQKGLLWQELNCGRWRIAPLFQDIEEYPADDRKIWEDLGGWYAAHDCIREALECLQHAENPMLYQECIIRNFSQVPFLDVPYEEEIRWKDNRPEACYLRGMCAYFRQDSDGLQEEIDYLDKIGEKSHLEREVYLNLCYVNVGISMGQWLSLLEKMSAEEGGEKQGAFRLYQMAGGSVSFLSGLRDLTEMFACPKKEENKNAKIWSNCLGADEWKGYQLARMEYYIETGRSSAIAEVNLLEDLPEGDMQYHLAVLYLLYRLKKYEAASELERLLLQNANHLCRKNAEAICCLYARGQDQMVKWLKEHSADRESEINEFNFVQHWCMAKGYLFLYQYEKAGKILRRLIPFLQSFHKRKWTAEALFQMALVYWADGRRNQALRSAIESFLITGGGRYVEFYTLYGSVGKEVLEEYIEWLHGNKPEGWHRKKKYNYGNVLRMPMEDYVEAILRKAKKEARNNAEFASDVRKERLTMTETIVFQCIGRGLTNQEICEELNLKLPTVKTHIYNIYKKLEASSRVQAILIGKEMGILDTL